MFRGCPCPSLSPMLGISDHPFILRSCRASCRSGMHGFVSNPRVHPLSRPPEMQALQIPGLLPIFLLSVLLLPLHRSIATSSVEGCEVVEALGGACFPGEGQIRLDGLDLESQLPSPGLFPAELSGYTSLYLNRSRILQVPVDLFTNLTSLRSLYLYLNPIHELPEEIFHPLHQLEILDLTGLQLTQLPPLLFSGLGHLKQLYLESNDLQTLPGQVFAPLDGLETLDLSYNKEISFDDPDSGSLFQTLTQLRRLELHDNNLDHLPDTIFHGLVNLEYLNLRINAMDDLPDSIFQDLQSLEVLILDYNRLQVLNSTAFLGLQHLKRLDLSHNRLTFLPMDVFSELEDLEILQLDSNSLAGLPGLSHLQHLRELWLGYNSYLPLEEEDFQGLSSLEFLSLERCRLSSLPTDLFAPLENLRVLHLQYNALQTFPAELSSLSELREINLQSNQLQSLEGLTGIPSLESLRLDWNQLTCLPEAPVLESIIHLNLNGNQITQIPTTLLGEAPRLERLEVENNYITDASHLQSLCSRSDGGGEREIIVPNMAQFVTLGLPIPACFRTPSGDIPGTGWGVPECQCAGQAFSCNTTHCLGCSDGTASTPGSCQGGLKVSLPCRWLVMGRW